eukprot:scaffold22540_cov137-Cylindrotheca_fusiformis.AAC.2
MQAGGDESPTVSLYSFNVWFRYWTEKALRNTKNSSLQENLQHFVVGRCGKSERAILLNKNIPAKSEEALLRGQAKQYIDTTVLAR